LLKADLLASSRVVVAGGVRAAVVDALGALGAELVSLDAAAGADAFDAEAWAAEHAPVHALVYDAAPAFAAGGTLAQPTGAAGLRAAVDDGWSAIHAVATAAFIGAEQSGTIVLLGPRSSDGRYVTAVRAALENTARTLSVEWARFGITTTAIAPGASTTDADIATLVAYLVSPAGRYFSGCRFELGAVG
jgi:hypothetical protein